MASRVEGFLTTGTVFKYRVAVFLFLCTVAPHPVLVILGFCYLHLLLEVLALLISGFLVQGSTVVGLRSWGPRGLATGCS